MSEIDLHVHTTCSDGTLSPSEVVELARSEKFKAIGIADHDTVDGNAEAKKAGERVDIEVIEGVEISAEYSPGTMHILGYFIDSSSPVLKDALGFVQRARRERNPRIIEKLRGLGFNITYDEVLAEAQGGQVGRPHFAQVLVKKGYVRDPGEAFARFLAKGAAAYINKERMSSAKSIKVIKAAGGLAVLAHPKQLKINDTKKLSRLIEKLIAEGLGGIEVYSSCHSRDEIQTYKELAQRFGLAVTAGSDFHGTNNPSVKLGDLGPGVDVKYNLVEEMKLALAKE